MSIEIFTYSGIFRPHGIGFNNGNNVPVSAHPYLYAARQLLLGTRGKT